MKKHTTLFKAFAITLTLAFLTACNNNPSGGYYYEDNAATETTELDPDDIDNLTPSQALELLREGIHELRQETPEYVTDGMMWTDILLKDNYLAFIYEVDEDILPIEFLQMGFDNVGYSEKEDAVDAMLDLDDDCETLLALCVKANKGLIVRYVSDYSGDYAQLKITPSELKSML